MVQAMEARQATLGLQDLGPRTMSEALQAAFAALPRTMRRRGFDALMGQPATRRALEVSAKAKLRKARRGR